LDIYKRKQLPVKIAAVSPAVVAKNGKVFYHCIIELPGGHIAVWLVVQ